MLPLTFPYNFRILSVYNKHQMLKPVSNNIAEATAPVRAEMGSTTAFKDLLAFYSKLWDTFLGCNRLKHSRS